MSKDPSHIQGRAETKAVKAAEKADAAGAAWADVNADIQAREDKTARLRAARLAIADEVRAKATVVPIVPPAPTTPEGPPRRIHRKKPTV